MEFLIWLPWIQKYHIIVNETLHFKFNKITFFNIFSFCFYVLNVKKKIPL